MGGAGVTAGGITRVGLAVGEATVAVGEEAVTDAACVSVGEVGVEVNFRVGRRVAVSVGTDGSEPDVTVGEGVNGVAVLVLTRVGTV